MIVIQEELKNLDQLNTSDFDFMLQIQDTNNSVKSIKLSFDIRKIAFNFKLTVIPSQR